MPNTPFTDADLRQLDERGVTVSEAARQLDLLRTPPAALDLVRPCIPGDGIVRLSREEIEPLRELQAGAARAGRFLKFVPASGAASRMFHGLRRFLEDPGWSGSWSAIVARARDGDADARDLVRLIEHLPETALFEELLTAAANRGADAWERLEAGDFRTLIGLMLGADDLNYSGRPKGLLAFHAEPGGGRTAFDEHLVESASYALDATGTGRLHFTVSPEHEPAFRARLGEVAERIGRRFGARFDVGFSVQEPSTDTLAAESDGTPLRDGDGRLVFRPGGHGALLANLDGLGADLVYVKNIDNVQPDALRGETVAWKRALGGLLVRLQDETFLHLDRLSRSEAAPDAVHDARRFVDRWFRVDDGAAPGSEEPGARDWLVRRLDRPIRVCGVVENTGEPGGGPFWVRDRDGRVSRQIVEAAQVAGDEARMEILRGATHFNPVDLVCAVSDRAGRPFDLSEFVDPDAAIVTEKSHDGRPIRVLERPGLWNGAMARWNTVFVEVPLETFSPVKTVFDLVREQHRTPR